jgi:hypothetical protein
MITPIKIVNAGIDTLVVGFSVAEYKDVEVFDVLYQAKGEAGVKTFGSKGTRVSFYEKEFVVMPRGTKGYEFVLGNDDVMICIAEKAQGGHRLPEVYVTFRAQYLWREGYLNAFNELVAWLNTWAIVVTDRVSRADLCMDIQMDLPKIDLCRDAVTRARGKIEYYSPCERYANGRSDTGYKYGSGEMVARIYDKTTEIKKTQKQWFEHIWKANGWDGKSKVTRIEFQARRGLLKEMSVDSVESLRERLADLWRYYTQDWLSIRTPTADKHKHRWPVAEWWQVIQNGMGLLGQAYGVLRDKQHVYRYDRLLKQVYGVTVSATGLLSQKFGLDGAIFKVKKALLEMIDSPDFRLDVFKRSAQSATMGKPKNNHLVEEAIRLGCELISVEDIDESADKS